MIKTLHGSRPIGFNKVEMTVDFTEYPESKGIYVSSTGPMNIDYWIEVELSIKEYLQHMFINYERKLSR